MRSRILASLFAIGAFCYGQNASALKVGALGGLNFSSIAVSNVGVATSPSGRTLLGFGAMGEVGLVPLFRLEADVMLLNHGMRNDPTDTTYRHLQIPVLVRFTGLPVINFGAGVYYSKALGSIDTSPVSGSGVTTSTDYSTARYKTWDFGVLASVVAEYEINTFIVLFADFRYVAGLVNQVDDPVLTTSSFKFNGFQAYAGIKFGL